MRIVLVFVVAIGVCIGAAIGWTIAGVQQANVALTELSVSLKGDTVQIGTLDAGWGPSTSRGSPLARQLATLVVPSDGLAKIDFIVDIELAGDAPRGVPLVNVDISVNGELIGAMTLGSTLARRLLLPKTAMSGAPSLKFVFRSSAKPPASVVVGGLALRDLSTLGA